MKLRRRNYLMPLLCMDYSAEAVGYKRRVFPQNETITVNPYQRDIEMRLAWESRKNRIQIIKGRRHLGLFNQIYQ